MKIYASSNVRVKKIDEPESMEIRQQLLKEFSDYSNIIFLGTYQDYRGRQAYKYILKHPDYEDDIEWVIPGEGVQIFDMANNFNDIAKRFLNKVYPKMPRSVPPNGWDTDKTITLTTEWGDKSDFDIIKSKQKAIKFLYGALYDINFPMMRLSYHQYDETEYIEHMQKFDTDDGVYGNEGDEDTVTYFYADGEFYSIDYETTLEEGIKIYYAIPNVESLHQSNANSAVIYKGYIFKDETGYYYSEMGECENSDDWEEVIEV